MIERLLPGIVRRRYAAKLTAAFLVVVVLTGAIGGYMYLDTSRQLQQDASYDMRNTATEQSSRFDAWINNSVRITKLVSQSTTAKSGDVNQIQPYLQGLIAGNQMTRGGYAVHYVEASSSRIAATTLAPRHNATPRQEGVAWASEENFDIGPYEVRVVPFRSRVTNETHVAFVTRIPGTTNGALVYEAKLSAMSEQLSPPSETAYTTIIDANGTFVLNQQRPGAEGTQHVAGPGVDSSAVEAGLRGETGYTRMNMGGEDLAMSYAPVHSTGWVLAVHDSPETIFSLRRDISQGVLLLLLSSILGLGLIGATVGRGTLNAITTLSTRARAMERGDLDVALESDREDEIGDLFAAFASMRDSLRETLDEVETERRRAEEQRRESEQLVAHLEEKAADYGAVMEATADGDLTRRVDPDSESEAMAQIGRAYNRTLDELEATLADVMAFAEVVADASEAAAAGVDEVESASEEVSRSVQEISEGAATQSERLGEVSDELTDLSATVEEIASATNDVAAQSDRATERGRTGREFADEATADMDRIQERTESAVASIERLSEQMEEVEEIVELIDRIAQQTNTLALNASVEAANAGGDGEGFAVVADEVKSLATETKEATDDVADLIGAIREQTDDSVAEMRAVREEVAEGRATIDETAEALDEIVEHVSDANDGVREIDAATDDQAATAQQVSDAVDDVANISEETTAESETVAAAAEQQTASLTEVSDNVRDLAARASRLREVLADFDVDRDGTADAAATRRSTAADGGASDRRD